nr:reverse transcriptase domain-containing protein [Tanacetum cinerariifolium]
MLFPFSLEGAARTWLEKEPPRSIHTWEDLVSKFVNYFLPPLKTTNLKNDITNFQQRFDETFNEAWDCFKDILCKCPHHSFSKLHHTDTFYNALTQSDQDSLNAAADGNILNRTPRDALTIIKNKSKVRTSQNKPIVSKVSTTTSYPSPYPDVTALTEIVKELLLMNNVTQQATISNMKTELKNEFKTTMLTQNNELKNLMSNELKNMMSIFIQMQSPSGSGSLPSNTVANQRGDLKAITTRSGVAYEGPSILPTYSFLPKEVEREPHVTKDKVQTTSLESTAHVQPPVVQVPILKLSVASKPNPKPLILYPSRLNDQKLHEKANNQMLKFPQVFQRLHFDISFADGLLHMPKFASTFKSLLKEAFASGTYSYSHDSRARKPMGFYLVGVAEDVFVKVGKFYFLADFVAVDYDVDPQVPLILGRPFLRTAQALIYVHGEELTLRINDEAITFKVGHTSRYSRNYYEESVNRIDVIDVSCEEYAQEVLRFLDSSTSGNPTPSDPIIASSFPSFTLFEAGDFILKEIETFLRTPDELSNLDNDYYDTKEDILYLEKLLNQDSSPNLLQIRTLSKLMLL